jgi:uncharacterized protein YcfJ
MRLAMIQGFRDELTKIALAGTVGAVGGFLAAPNSVAGKVIGTGAGAAIGGTAGFVGNQVKSIHQTQRERDRAAALNYVPSVVAQEQASPYGPYAV